MLKLNTVEIRAAIATSPHLNHLGIVSVHREILQFFQHADYVDMGVATIR